MTQLDSGVTVLTETESFPHQTDIGILIDVGSRDEVIF